ncbi:MAG: hypothetical protein WCG83_03165 [Candidatus Peregrinibacteria bacterium]
MTTIHHSSGFTALILWVSGVVALILSCTLLIMHVQAVTALRESALPLVAEAPALERRIALLKEQIDVAELQKALASGSQEERIRVSVLPIKTALDRNLMIFSLLQNDLEQRSLIGPLSPITVGDPRSRKDGLTAIPVTMQWKVRGEGMVEIFAFLRIAGLLTVGDALTQAQKSTLISATEAENPAAIVALEQFFATDLQSYGAEPRPFEEQLRRSLPSESFLLTLNPILRESLLHTVQLLFQGTFGQELAKQRLWPMPFIVLEKASIKAGSALDWYQVDMTVLLLSRGT